MSSTPLLQIDHLSVSYRTARGHVPAVRDVSFEVQPGKVTAIVGESGSGKTTIAQSVIGLLAPNANLDHGNITLNERRLGATSLVGLPQRRWRDLRGRCIGLIPQDPGGSFNPIQTIGGAISESLRIHGNRSRAEIRDHVHALLEQVGIDDPERRAKQYPHEFSGGMRQRALIAAAIANRPELIIADEPTSALDVTVQRTVLDLLDSLRQESGSGVLFITHDLALAADRADSVVVLRDGQVQEQGPSTQVFGNPTSSYTKQLLQDAPSLNPVTTRERATVSTRHASPSADPLVRVTGLSHTFGRGADKFVAVNDVSFTVARGTTHALVGESGSGKTTTGRAIAGLNTPTGGSVIVDGVEVTDLRGKKLRPYRRITQLVYQNPYASLDPRLSIGDTLREPLRNALRVPHGEWESRVCDALELVSLPREFQHRKPRELSGGQRQRVAIARALIMEPQLMVLDEAVSALDVTVQAQILRLLTKLQADLGLSYVFISHDLAVVQQIADTVSVLQRGTQVESGRCEEVLREPQHPYTKQLLASVPGTVMRSGQWVI